MFIVIKQKEHYGDVTATVELKTEELNEAQKFIHDSVNNALVENDGLEFVDREEITNDMDLSALSETKVGVGVMLSYETEFLGETYSETFIILEV